MLILLFFASVQAFGGEEPAPKERVVITHYVATGETLWNIAKFYCPPDRDIREFIEGIYEGNYDSVFYQRERQGGQKKTVYPGDRLRIEFWARVSRD